jgi:F-type H+-transporting ATPase subunit epsilon
MASTTHLDIVSAEREIFSGPVEMVYAPAAEGEVGIHPRHTALITTLHPGEVRAVHPGGQEEAFFVSGGILEVQPHVVTVLSDTAVRAEDVDEASAMAAKERAEQSLRDRQGSIDYATARAELADAMAQLQAIQRIRRRVGR